MKRGEINNQMRAAERCPVTHAWALPSNARWDVTNFGLSAWRQFGLVLVNLAEEPESSEKLMYAQGGKRIPAHCYRSKKAVIKLDAGSRITLLPEFYPLSQERILGEGSAANDDTNHNYFVNPNIGCYPVSRRTKWPS